MTERGACLDYTVRYARICFTGKEEDGAVCCARCPLMETYSRKQCRLTGEYLGDDRNTGRWCPLTEDK